MGYDTFGELRSKIDGSDAFMTWGHQINVDRGRTGGVTRRVPEWTKSDKQIREILVRSFPNWESNPVQKNRMLNWNTIIYHHYRRQVSAGRIAAHLKISLDDVRNILSRIRKAGTGLNTVGKVRTIRAVSPDSVKRRERRAHGSEAKDFAFMEQILAPERWARIQERTIRLMPDWTKSKKKIYNLVETSFPRWYQTQGDKAKFWFQVIHYYYRRKASYKEVARVLCTSDSKVISALERIDRAAEVYGTTERDLNRERQRMEKWMEKILPGSTKSRADF